MRRRNMLRTYFFGVFLWMKRVIRVDIASGGSRLSTDKFVN